ncbi:MAG: hypothetical protein H2041_14700 [Phenylobacterium sp.]|uniref:hypothetical protein n=1 Tax=Phenylobacterium sp. TaxID=1871053 RepID=UPI0017BADF21|nr:hypothetical protein [Phenylobacterium sp.]MBA4794908.1 hypothetical protein [Phenylobacterium sp.]
MTARNLALAAGAWAALSTLIVALPAEAGAWGRTVNVQGPNGRGYVQSQNVSRQAGAVSASRSTQTNYGYGSAHARGATWGGGVYQGGASHSYNSGAYAGRSTTVVDNGDGTASYDYSRTGFNGQTTTASGTIDRAR